MVRAQIDEAIELIRMEFAECPALKITFWQAQRLWNLREDVCAAALQKLTDRQFLSRAADGSYIRTAWPDRYSVGARDAGIQLFRQNSHA